MTQRSSALTARPTTAPPPRTATAAVGALPGTGWVGHDGAYHYRIPIEVPPGRAGMAPSLALTYSSKSGNGPVGVGFSLEGASSITRCERAMAAGGERDRVSLRQPRTSIASMGSACPGLRHQEPPRRRVPH